MTASEISFDASKTQPVAAMNIFYDAMLENPTLFERRIVQNETKFRLSNDGVERLGTKTKAENSPAKTPTHSSASRHHTPRGMPVTEFAIRVLFDEKNNWMTAADISREGCELGYNQGYPESSYAPETVHGSLTTAKWFTSKNIDNVRHFKLTRAGSERGEELSEQKVLPHRRSGRSERLNYDESKNNTSARQENHLVPVTPRTVSLIEFSIRTVFANDNQWTSAEEISTKGCALGHTEGAPESSYAASMIEKSVHSENGSYWFDTKMIDDIRYFKLNDNGYDRAEKTYSWRYEDDSEDETPASSGTMEDSDSDDSETPVQNGIKRESTPRPSRGISLTEFAIRLLFKKENQWMTPDEISTKGRELGCNQDSPSSQYSPYMLSNLLKSTYGEHWFESKTEDEKVFFRLSIDGQKRAQDAYHDYGSDDEDFESQEMKNLPPEHPPARRRKSLKKEDDNTSKNMPVVEFSMRVLHAKDNQWMTHHEISKQGCELGINQDASEALYNPTKVRSSVSSTTFFEWIKIEKKRHFRLNSTGWKRAQKLVSKRSKNDSEDDKDFKYRPRKKPRRSTTRKSTTPEKREEQEEPCKEEETKVCCL
jgi:hypothetical protein